MNLDSLGREIAAFLVEHSEVKVVRTFGVCADEIEVVTKDGETYYIEVGTYLGDDKNDED